MIESTTSNKELYEPQVKLRKGSVKVEVITQFTLNNICHLLAQ